MADKGSSSSGSENGDSRNSSRSSASEEERLRRLFNSCDADGDGFLDGDDLTFMCRMLNMADSVDEVRQQLGLTDTSRISFNDFLRCRTRVMLESTIHHSQHALPAAGLSPSPGLLSTGEDTGIESDTSGRVGSLPSHQLTSWPTMSSDSLGALSCTKPESADYDSGARDLSPEPVNLTLTQLMETHDPQALYQLQQAGAHTALEIANRLHAAALTSMKGEILELKHHIHRLSAVTNSLDTHGQNSHEAKLDGLDFENRLEQLTSRYEERIIELHSVIAELRKKLDRHQINVIREEEEYEDTDQAHSTQSNDGESMKDENNDISREFSRVVSEIQTAMAAEPDTTRGDGPTEDSTTTATTSSLTVERVEASGGREAENIQASPPTPPCCDPEDTAEDTDVPPALPPRAARPCTLPHSTSATLAFDASQSKSEVTSLRADNEELRRQTSQLEVELGQLSGQMGTVMRQKEGLMKKVLELQQRLQAVTTPTSPSHSRVATPTKQTPTPPPLPDTREPEVESFPVAKMAELKKLRMCASNTQVLGSEVAMMGVQSTTTAEHLVQAVQDGSSLAELLKSAGTTHGAVDVPQGTVREFEVELERRQAKIDHLKAQNDVLMATLEESKSHAERLSVLIGKYESNNTALQLSAAFSDHCLEAQDVLTALLDTEMGVLLANCRAAGLGGLAGSEGDEEQEQVTAILQRAHHARRRSEGVARHLLTRLDRNCGNHTNSGLCHPWEDVSTNSRTASTSSTASSTDAEFTKTEELRLRNHIHQLKTERAAVRTTVMELESVHVDPVMSEPRRWIEAQRLDLENAVLVQELMAVKEEKAELKAHSYLLEKEKRALELRLSGKETQEQAFRVQIEHLKGELQEIVTSTSAPATLQHEPRTLAELKGRNPGELARDLTLTQERERTLKSRISELMSTLEKISRNSESRHRQSAEFINDLKRANSALISAFDKAKKKYQGRLKKMETQLKSVRDKYEMETNSLRQRIGTRELRGSSTRPVPNETSL